MTRKEKAKLEEAVREALEKFHAKRKPHPNTSAPARQTRTQRPPDLQTR